MAQGGKKGPGTGHKRRSGKGSRRARRLAVGKTAARSAPRVRHRAPKRRRSFWRGLFYWGLVAALWGGFVIGIGIATLASGLPDTSNLWKVERQPSITYVDMRGRQIAVRGASYAPPVHIDELPPHLVGAVLAIEDRRFYHHFGVDPIGLARAFVTNLRHGSVVQGGSTLTQQLAKNLFLSNARTYRRKAQEVLLAFWLESRFSKKEILSLYLNRVYFGRGAWGVEAAARRYFGKSAKTLSLGESAMIAGLLKAPNRYSPTSDLARAERRATVVLDVMVKAGKISAEERAAAFAYPVHVQRNQASPAALYFVDWLAPQVRRLTGDTDADLVVETSLDLDRQRASESAIAGVLDDKAQARGATQAALVAMDGDGAVRAMAGGRSYALSQFNRATQARRQPGSAFKPFVYLAAIESGLTPWTVRKDAPVRIGDWQPQNYSGKYRGDMALITALAKSINSVAVRLANEVGRGRIAEAAHRMGMTSHIALTRSMPLGSNGVSLLELTSAYAPFANGGMRARPYGLVRISTRAGEVLWRRPVQAPKPVLAPRSEALMNIMLQRVMRAGTGRHARLKGRISAGKTGTTNDFRDAWFVGYASGHIAGVWVGDDKNRAMKKVTGGTLPAHIWHAYMISALKDIPLASPSAPAAAVIAAAKVEATARQQAMADAKPAQQDPLGALLETLPK